MQQVGTAEVRTYRAKTQADATELMASDFGPMAQRGLTPSVQLWTGPQIWRTLVTPVVLIMVGLVVGGVYGAAIGALIGIGYMVYRMAVARPKGTLTVTFTVPPYGALPAWATKSGPATMSFAK